MPASYGWQCEYERARARTQHNNLRLPTLATDRRFVEITREPYKKALKAKQDLNNKAADEYATATFAILKQHSEHLDVARGRKQLENENKVLEDMLHADQKHRANLSFKASRLKEEIKTEEESTATQKETMEKDEQYWTECVERLAAQVQAGPEKAIEDVKALEATLGQLKSTEENRRLVREAEKKQLTQQLADAVQARQDSERFVSEQISIVERQQSQLKTEETDLHEQIEETQKRYSQVEEGEFVKGSVNPETHQQQTQESTHVKEQAISKALLLEKKVASLEAQQAELTARFAARKGVQKLSGDTIKKLQTAQISKDTSEIESLRQKFTDLVRTSAGKQSDLKRQLREARKRVEDAQVQIQVNLRYQRSTAELKASILVAHQQMQLKEANWKKLYQDRQDQATTPEASKKLSSEIFNNALDQAAKLNATGSTLAATEDGNSIYGEIRTQPGQPLSPDAIRSTPDSVIQAPVPPTSSKPLAPSLLTSSDPEDVVSERGDSLVEDQQTLNVAGQIVEHSLSGLLHGRNDGPPVTVGTEVLSNNSGASVVA